MTDWRQWLEEMEERAQLLEREAYTVPDAVEARCMVHSHSLPRLFEGYRLLAEAVEAIAAVDEHPDGDCKECCGEFSPHCDVLFELGRVADEAGRKALDHLRGVGRDSYQVCLPDQALETSSQSS